MSSPTLNPLERLLRLNGSSPEFHDQISNILYGAEYVEWARDIEGDDVMGLVDCLDRLLDALEPTSPSFRKCLRELKDKCGEKLRLPKSYSLHSQVLHVGHLPVASGGFGDIYEGKLNGEKVCIKRLRVYARNGPERPTKTLYQEAVMWKRAKHKNIVPLFGITMKPLQLVSEWMPHGNLTEYIGNNPDTSRLGLLSDIAEGLDFLHSCNIVHGDLKGPNILLDKQGCARITDFGLTTVTQNLDSIQGASDDRGHTGRWAAPEILNGAGFSKEADVFSFSMVMIEAFTGAVPFDGKAPATAMLSIMGGERPPRPSHPQLTSNLWALMQRCWDKNPASRPEVSVISTIFYGTQVGQAHARTDGAGIPHADLRSAPGRGKKPKKDSNGIGPRLDPNHGPDDDTEGKYWSRGKDTRVASLPYLNEAHNPGGTSRNFSNVDLPKDPSRDRSSRHGQPKETNRQRVDKNSSYANLADTGGGGPSNDFRGLEIPMENSGVRNTPPLDPKLSRGTKSRNQHRQGGNETLPENVDIPLDRGISNGSTSGLPSSVQSANPPAPNGIDGRGHRSNAKREEGYEGGKEVGRRKSGKDHEKKQRDTTEGQLPDPLGNTTVAHGQTNAASRPTTQGSSPHPSHNRGNTSTSGSNGDATTEKSPPPTHSNTQSPSTDGGGLGAPGSSDPPIHGDVQLRQTGYPPKPNVVATVNSQGGVNPPYEGPGEIPKKSGCWCWCW